MSKLGPLGFKKGWGRINGLMEEAKAWHIEAFHNFTSTRSEWGKEQGAKKKKMLIFGHPSLKDN